MSTSITNHSRREKWVPPPSAKRKERDGNGPLLKPLPLTTKKLAKPSPHHRHPPPLSPKPSPQQSPKPSPKPLSNNHLLAGYLAHEFLSKGTLFGEAWDPARAQAVPVSAAGSSRLKLKQVELEREKYKEVAELMNGVHIPGVVNPTQLARYLQLR